MEATTVHMAVYDELSDWEVGFATAHIQKASWQKEPGRYQVVTVGRTKDPVTTMGGMRILPDVTLDELRPEDSAMLIMAGADTWDDGSNGDFAKKARQFLDAGTPVAAICGATFGLAQEGLLDDRDHTSNAVEYLQAAGYAGAERFRYEAAVTDGDLITGSGVQPVEFAREIFAKLGVYEPATLAAWYKLYGQHDPAGYFELEGGA
jgi:putative intracellular protease/amidase